MCFHCNEGLTTSQKPQPRGTSQPGLQVARRHASFGSQPLFDGIFLVPLKRGIHPLRWGIRSAQPRSLMRFSTQEISMYRGVVWTTARTTLCPMRLRLVKGPTSPMLELPAQTPSVVAMIHVPDTELPLISARRAKTGGAETKPESGASPRLERNYASIVEQYLSIGPRGH